MLEWLTRSGRLQVVGPDGGFCPACAQVADCRLLALHGNRFVLAQQAPSEAAVWLGGPVTAVT